MKNALRKTLPVLLVTLVIGTLLPNKTTMYAMLAASSGEQLVSSETAQRLAPKTLALLEKYMNEQLTKISDGDE